MLFVYLKTDNLGIGFRDRLCIKGRGTQQHLIGTDTQSPPVTFKPVTSTSLNGP